MPLVVSPKTTLENQLGLQNFFPICITASLAGRRQSTSNATLLRPVSQAILWQDSLSSLLILVQKSRNFILQLTHTALHHIPYFILFLGTKFNLGQLLMNSFLCAQRVNTLFDET
jgi:hypothetical protein